MTDFEALKICVQRSHGTPLAKSRLLKKLEKDFRKGKVVPRQFNKTLCRARVMMGDFSNWDGWEFRSDYAATCWFEGEARIGLPKWAGEGHVLVLAEEGIGDEVLFMSLLPEVLKRCPKVTVECDGRLESILRRSFPRTETTPRKGSLTGIREWLAATPGPRSWILMGDLARIFRHDKSHFPGKPYLLPDPERVRQMEGFRGRVGVSWAGNHGRYDPSQFLSLVNGPVNLQYNESHSKASEPGIDLRNDLEGLFALCSVLSRVVTVSTSVAHIACSVGTPTDVIHALPRSGGDNDMDILNWKWGPEGKTPWYGAARVFRNLKQYEMAR